MKLIKNDDLTRIFKLNQANYKNWIDERTFEASPKLTFVNQNLAFDDVLRAQKLFNQ